MKKFFQSLFSFLTALFFLCVGIFIARYIDSKKPKQPIILPNINTVPTQTKETIHLTFVGDLLFESLFYESQNKDKYFSNVENYFSNDDISVGNMEVVIGNDKLSVSGDGYNFCAPRYIGDLVNKLDFQILSTANNHANDRGLEGINSTIDYFKNYTNIKTVGTYKDEDDRNNLRVIKVRNVRFGFLSYTLGTNIVVDKSNRNKIGLYRDPDTKTITNEYKEIIKREVENLKAVSDIQVVMMHWGNEFTFTPNNEQREMAEYLNELGVDIIYGSHSHSMQPIEIIDKKNKTLVFYSLGNFASQDDDIARTPLGQETFDNAYQIGLLSQIDISFEDNVVGFEKIHTIPIINHFDKNKKQFQLIPFEIYDEELEKSHYRYKLGLTREFITDTFNSTIKEEFR